MASTGQRCFLSELPPELFAIVSKHVTEGSHGTFFIGTGKLVDEAGPDAALATMHPLADAFLDGYAIDGTVYVTKPPSAVGGTRWIELVDERGISRLQADFGQEGANMIPPVRFHNFVHCIRSHVRVSLADLKRWQASLRGEDVEVEEDEEDDNEEPSSWTGPPTTDLRLRVSSSYEEFSVLCERHDTRDIIPKSTPENRAIIGALYDRLQTCINHVDTRFLPVDGSVVQRQTGRLRFLALSKTLQIFSPRITIVAQIPMIARIDPHQIDDEHAKHKKQHYSLYKHLFIVPKMWINEMASTNVDALPSMDDGLLQCYQNQGHDGGGGMPMDPNHYLTHWQIPIQQDLVNKTRLLQVRVSRVAAMLIYSFYAKGNRFIDVASKEVTNDLILKARSREFCDEYGIMGIHVQPTKEGKRVIADTVVKRGWAGDVFGI